MVVINVDMRWQVSKDCDCDNLDQDVSGYTCYKCYEKGK
jgi:nitrous oxide reductase